MKKVAGLLLVAYLSTYAAAAQGAEKKTGTGGATARVNITAPVGVVWDVVHIERASDPDLIYSKVLERNGNKVVLEQKFSSVPILGEAVCQLAQEETPLKRIDYSLMRSNKYKEMCGSWVFTEMPDGSTQLELCSTVDTGIPLAKGLVHMMLKDKLQKRLERIKKASESREIASKGVEVTPAVDSPPPNIRPVDLPADLKNFRP